jgi:hypothetical protein
MTMINMKRDTEAIMGLTTAAISYAVTHWNAIAGGLIALLALGVWALKFRREWNHRNDPPE